VIGRLRRASARQRSDRCVGLKQAVVWIGGYDLMGSDAKMLGVSRAVEAGRGEFSCGRSRWGMAVEVRIGARRHGGQGQEG
jgi:hypothetical protein